MNEMDGLNKIEIMELLQSGPLDIEGYLPWSSNYTFLVRVFNEQVEAHAVYKPREGERPLWDFTHGTLCQREKAAYVVSDALSWDLIPPTVMRNGPHGLGSLQLFVEHDPECHYFTFEGKSDHRLQLQQIALLDIIINNADRKGGHILLDQSEGASGGKRLWAIDHGICFHTSYKLRTVVWEFAGKRIPAQLMADLRYFREKLNSQAQELSQQLDQLLTGAEILAIQRRLDQLIERGAFLEPGSGRHYPWPPV